MERKSRSSGTNRRNGAGRMGSGSSKLDKYLAIAKKKGAAHALAIRSNDVVIDPRTYLKCMYGCKDWGKNWTCPSAPGAIAPWQFGEIFLKRYKTAILIHCTEKKPSQKISYAIEREAFLDGFYFAFSMSDCAICQECAWPQPCRNKKHARPAMQALGIDVYATVKKLGLPLFPLRGKEEPQNWYSLVLIE